jgi:multisubunit Na+/H+ antiporter MnhG subunit
MSIEKKFIATNVAVGLLSIFIGIDNLLRWSNNHSDTKSMVIGIICIVLAVSWLVITLLSKKKTSKVEK